MSSFELIDDKTLYCHKIFINNSITDRFERDELTSTWEYHNAFSDLNIEYGSLYAEGKTLTECCPDQIRSKWKRALKQNEAYLRSFQTGRIKLTDVCLYDLMPEWFVKLYFSLKLQINDHVIQTVLKPKHYDFLVDLSELVFTIRQQPLCLDFSVLQKNISDQYTRKTLKRLREVHPYIDYNIFGSVTGRLGLQPHSFPILNLKKEYRQVLKPCNDFFVELDYNAAEFRSLLALMGHDQPQQDLHQFHLDKIMSVTTDEMSRDAVKTKMFKWLYGGGETLGIAALEVLYNKTTILQQYTQGGLVKNPYGREIEVDGFHSLSYLNQGFLSDIFLRQVLKVFELLRGRKSKIAWMIHDSLVIDMSQEDFEAFDTIKRTFEHTDFGVFPSNTKMGKNFYHMRRV